jgi:carbamoyltransferase
MPPQRRPSRTTARGVVLGVNAHGHDAAAALLVDGRIAFAASEERYDRVRGSAAFPARAIAEALASVGATPADVSLVAVPWTRGMARARKAWHVLARLPRSVAFLREPPGAGVPTRRGYLAAMRGIERDLEALGVRAPVRRVPHHLAHAASAALVLPGGSGAVLTADGMGEWTTGATWEVRGGVPALRRRASYPHSPGKAYAAVTSWLGFRPEHDEGKTMGLAALGDPDSPAARFTRSLVSPDAERLLRVDVDAFGFPWGEARLYGDRFLEALGPPRPADAPLRVGDADAARGIQDAIEAFALDASKRLLAETRAEALGLAGGLFLNCAMNGVLARALDVPVLPMPVAGDAGAALGAAALVHRLETGAPAEPLSTLRLGHEITTDEARRVLEPLGARSFALEALAEEVAARVARGGLVGVARGRSELGPRALGGRSVLARADDPRVRDRLNDQKGRERWRPVAPVVRAEDLDALFRPATPSPWMILTLVARADAAAGPLGGVVHADGTARVQSVTAASEPFLHAVLGALAPRGHRAVIDTSLNRRGEPIVDTAEQALEAARAIRLDALVVGDRLLDLRG